MSDRLVVERLRIDRGGAPLLRDIDLSVRAGEVLAILGPNGVGKSTLLAACAGLLTPASGHVDARGRVATLLQTPALANRRVEENVELALRWSGQRTTRSERRDRAHAALERLGVEHLAGRSASTLSGGEARRVHLARGVVVEPEILLLDEPFAGLDAGTRADLLYDAASVRRSPDRATVIVVHDRAEAWALADRVAVLLDGVLEQVGSPEEVFRSPATERVADFVGFTGSLVEGDVVRRLRVGDVSLSDDGQFEATVVRRIPLEDGVRVELRSETAALALVASAPGPLPGSVVRFSVGTGCQFARSPS